MSKNRSSTDILRKLGKNESETVTKIIKHCENHPSISKITEN